MGLGKQALPYSMIRYGCRESLTLNPVQARQSLFGVYLQLVRLANKAVAGIRTGLYNDMSAS